MDFKKSVEGHLTYLRKLKDYTEERLEKMPEGSLRRKKTREKMYCYLKSGHQEFSLLKYPGLRDIYIEKEWLQGRLKAIDKDIPVLERLLSDYAAICPNPGEWEFFKGEQNEYKKEESKRQHICTLVVDLRNHSVNNKCPSIRFCNKFIACHKFF